MNGMFDMLEYLGGRLSARIVFTVLLLL